MTEKDLKECFDVFNDFWKILKKYKNTKDWDTIIMAADAVAQNHGVSEFAKNVEYAVLGVLAEKERERKQKQ